MKQVRTYIHTLAFSLLALFSIYYGSIVVFAHVHVVNGVMLVHSHPFKHTHAHTPEQFLVLQSASAFHSLEAELPGLPQVILPLLYELSSDLSVCQVVLELTDAIRLRAPPVASFL